MDHSLKIRATYMSSVGWDVFLTTYPNPLLSEPTPTPSSLALKPISTSNNMNINTYP
jgi:hypothetical protein